MLSKILRLTILGIIIILICWLLNGCIFPFAGGAIGSGKIKYYPDGQIKELESKIMPELSLIKIPTGE